MNMNDNQDYRDELRSLNSGELIFRHQSLARKLVNLEFAARSLDVSLMTLNPNHEYPKIRDEYVEAFAKHESLRN